MRHCRQAITEGIHRLFDANRNISLGRDPTDNPNQVGSCKPTAWNALAGANDLFVPIESRVTAAPNDSSCRAPLTEKREAHESGEDY